MTNSTIQVALIGAGGMGTGDTNYARSLPGVKLVAVCDIYDGRLTRARERWGADLYTTRDYREVLARQDIDAVIIATPDHWHSRITIDALQAGKDVYCEKPMIHAVEEGAKVVAAQRSTGRILQIGSQYVSSAVYQRAKELIAAKAIGDINVVEAWLDRNTALGAWQYSMPPDATPTTIDWDRFLGSAPKRPFEPVRLFRWRNYRDYGTGVAGDLFVHLLSGLHFATGSTGPTRVYATGGLRFWKDGRDVPDVMLALLEYPKTAAHTAFTTRLLVNFESGRPDESFGVKFTGSEGSITTSFTGLTLTKHKREVEPDYTIKTFARPMREQLLKAYHADQPQPDKVETFEPPKGHDAHLEHHRNFYEAVRTRKPFVEDGVFGFRAAGPALLTNVSYFERRVCDWDPEAMAIKA